MPSPRGVLAAACAVAVATLTPALTTPSAAAAPTVVVSFASGKLTVTGTPGADRIKLTSANGRVVVTSNRAVRRTGAAPLVTKVTRIVIKGGAGDDKLVMAATSTRLPGARLDGGPGDDVLRGGIGDDTYTFTGGGSDTVQEVDHERNGVDTLDLRAVPGPVSVDLSSTDPQPVATGLTVTLSSGASVENVVGGPGDDTLAGNLLDNDLTGGAGADTFVVRDRTNADRLVDFAPADGDRLSLPDLKARDVFLDAAGTTLTSWRGAAYGVEATFGLPVRTSGGETVLGTTSDGGSIVTWDGAGGYSQATNDPVLVMSYVAVGVTLGGAAGDDHIVDRSPGGSSLVGRDGNDTLVGGPGDDTLQGDRGFSSGMGTTDWLFGGAGADTFVFGEAFGGGGPEAFGGDVVFDFEHGVDTISLYPGMEVRSSLGSDTVNVFLGDQFQGSITGTTPWEATDFA